MPKAITLAVISDLHYRQHEAGSICRPATATEIYNDPIAGLFKLIRERPADLRAGKSTIADYLLCPGDICDQADHSAFTEGWSQLNRLRDTLGASALIASTGNHEVESRADPKHQEAGNVLNEVTPIGFLQGLKDYPSALLELNDRRWVYWGRGYEIIEQQDILFLLINSSYFHVTTQQNEFQRGRMNDAAIAPLREELRQHVEKNKNRLFITLLHHHPIDHQNLDVSLGRITMQNGQDLMQLLMECNVAWLVIHGHKHFPRLIRHDCSGPGKTVVFGAGSAGTQLKDLALQTKLQFYLIDAEIQDQNDSPAALGRVRAFSWTGSQWEPTTKLSQGLPNGCGYSIPDIPLKPIADKLKTELQAQPYFTWKEVVSMEPALGSIFPGNIESIRTTLANRGIECLWDTGDCFPVQLALRRSE